MSRGGIGIKRIEFGRSALLAVLALATIACGQPLTTAEQTQTAVAGAATPAVTEAAPDLSATSAATPNYPPGTPAPPPTPQAVTPVPAATAGRTDCPKDWNAYVDPDRLLSVCYPAGWIATQSGKVGLYPAGFTLQNTQLDILIGVSIVDQTPVTSGAVSSLGKLCAVFASAHGFEFTLEKIRLAGIDADACVGHGDAGEEGIDPLYAYVALSNGQWLQVDVSRGSAAAEIAQLILSVLETFKPL